MFNKHPKFLKIFDFHLYVSFYPASINLLKRTGVFQIKAFVTFVVL